jgi:hypothetical protein
VIPQHTHASQGVVLPSFRDAHRLRPGEGIEITYDADDLILSEFLIEGESLSTPALLSTTLPSERRDTFTITDPARLPAAAQSHIDGARRWGSWTSWASLFVFMVPLTLLSLHRLSKDHPAPDRELAA